MPINTSALSGPPEPDPDQQPPSETAAAAVSGDTNEQEAEAPKRTRRTKAQMIADAVIPADDDSIELKDSGTGAKITRPWLVALEMVRDGKAEWADREMKYAMLKWDQQKVSGAFAEPTVDEGEPVSEQQKVTQLMVVPPDAEVGDEVSIGSDTFRVGHNRELVDGSRPIAINDEIIKPQRRWIREIGSGANGPWEAVPPLGGVSTSKAQENGNSTPVEPVILPAGVEVEQVSLRGWRIGTGVLEKIGLPDYSSLQVGPITASREVYDDGRRTTVEIGGRTAAIPTAVVEVAREAADIVEYIARYQRGELVSFLESTGALKQPVSS